jgi:hypothetical protein
MRLLVCALGLLLLITGCSAAVGDPTELAVPEPAKHAPAPRPQDRDEKAVLTALVNTNPCLLVDAEQQKASLLARPHECELSMSDGDGQILFVARRVHEERYRFPAQVINGVRVDTVIGHDRDCSMDIPVSFHLAVRVSASSDHEPCAAATALATTVLGRVDRFAQAAHPDAMPDLKKRACSVLGAAITDAGLGTATGVAIGMPDDLDGCAVDADAFKNVHLEFRIYPDPAEHGWTTVDTIAGKTVYRRPGPCGWAWSEGKFADDNVRLVMLGANDCPSDLPKKLVPALVAQLAKPAVPSTADRLTIPANQPDEPNPGACVDYQLTACEPGQGVRLPEGAGPKTVAAVADPHVACALAAKAVTGQFPGMRPVVDTEKPSCVFVEPTHAVVIEVKVTSGDSAVIDVAPKPVTIDGHHGSYREAGDPTWRASVCVNSGFHTQDDPDKWYWCMVASFSTSREHPYDDVDMRGKAKLEPAMNAFAREHLR